MNGPSLATIRQKRNYATLDGLRGFAALAVASRHFSAELAPIHLAGSYLAVDIFFVMSGFVLANSYDDRLHQDLSQRIFLRNRLIRVYPLYLVSILIVTLGVAGALLAHIPLMWDAHSLTISLILSLLFLPTPQMLTGTTPLFPLNGPAWSLFMEIAVNLVYATSRRWLTERRLNWFLLASGISLAAAVAWHGNADIGAEWNTLAISPPRVCFSFFLGVAFFRWERADKLPRIPLPAWSLPCLMLAIFAVEVAGQARAIFDILALFVLLPLLLIAGFQNEPKRCQGLFTVLGLASYPIYVLHVPLQKYIENVLARLTGGNGHEPYAGLIILALLLPLGWLAHRYFDAPVRRWLARPRNR